MSAENDVIDLCCSDDDEQNEVIDLCPPSPPSPGTQHQHSSARPSNEKKSDYYDLCSDEEMTTVHTTPTSPSPSPGTHQQSSVPKQRARPSNEEKPSHKRTKADNNEVIEGYNPDDPGLRNLQSTFHYYSAQYTDLTDPGLNDGEDDGDEDNDGLSEYDSKVEQLPFDDLSHESAQLLPPVLSQLVMAMKCLGMMVQDAWLIYSLALVQANLNECPNVMAAIAASVALAAHR